MAMESEDLYKHHKILSLDVIVNQLNLQNISTKHILMSLIWFILRFPKWSIPIRFSNKNFISLYMWHTLD